MSNETNQENEIGFVVGQHYEFSNPPLETNCVPCGGAKKFERKKFAEGWCINYDETRGFYVFQGKPIGEKLEHYFTVEWGKGSVAENVAPPHLRRIK
ncbi:hypothetical protein A2442_03225 [Candidatus Campbellbacteria bacterium RIFOXYC2_FULL_35_25]|uniref:Uncharacterized protein n=1 Tax=Candidatus Campbellbacteria bacterium RIFOXYC2_FULL_35_25 TaxID=1797582 RepID=A0A1F5EJ84_9BACT|nr:MAG: hypothetical protein A2442_03225 [Candidatus Campbellbacteria bacterium RIFOXYC2_FULL_35_25]